MNRPVAGQIEFFDDLERPVVISPVGKHEFEFVARAKLTPTIRPGQVLIYHAWGGQQFLTGKAPDDISPSPLKVTRLIGNYGHLVQSWIWEPTQNDRDTRVDMRKYTP